MSVALINDWSKISNARDALDAADSVTITSFTFTGPMTGTGTVQIWADEYPVYTDGTKLLRDYAMLSNDYLEKKEISQAGWKSRYELRNG